MGKISTIHSGKRSAGYKTAERCKNNNLHAGQTASRTLAISRLYLIVAHEKLKTSYWPDQSR
jgi:hypothetical protein